LVRVVLAASAEPFRPGQTAGQLVQVLQQLKDVVQVRCDLHQRPGQRRDVVLDQGQQAR